MAGLQESLNASLGRARSKYRRLSRNMDAARLARQAERERGGPTSGDKVKAAQKQAKRQAAKQEAAASRQASLQASLRERLAGALAVPAVLRLPGPWSRSGTMSSGTGSFGGRWKMRPGSRS